MRPVAVCTALAPVFLLAACGGGSSQITSMQALQGALSKAGAPCEGYTRDDQPTIGASEVGSCKINGQQTYLTLYTSSKTHEQVSKAFAALQTGYHVEGDRWTVEVTDHGLAQKIADKLGGKLA